MVCHSQNGQRFDCQGFLTRKTERAFYARPFWCYNKVLTGAAMIFTVEYTNESQVGNQTLTMEIGADDLDSAWELLDQHWSHIDVDAVYAKESAYYGA